MAILESSTQTGVSWAKESLALFKKNPRQWLLLALAYIGLFLLLPSIPGLQILGVISILFWPAFIALAMLMYKNADNQVSENLSQMLAKLKPTLTPLMLLGLLCLVYGALVSLLLASDMQWLTKMTQAGQNQTAISQEEAAQIIAKGLPVLFKLMLLSLPLLLVTWFSPMLIALNNYALGKAIKSSLAGALQYAIAMSITGIVLIAGLVALILIVLIFVGIIGLLVPMAAPLLSSLAVLAAMLLTTALMLAFQYVSYRDVFKAA